MKINGFDIDGVIHLGNGVCGVRPGPNDVIITGRSYEEEPETKAFLHKHGIKNHVYKNRQTSHQIMLSRHWALPYVVEYIPTYAASVMSSQGT